MSTELDAIRKAMHEGLGVAVREATMAMFNVYRESEHEPDQQKRTGNGLIEIATAAENMHKLIDEVTDGRP